MKKVFQRLVVFFVGLPLLFSLLLLLPQHNHLLFNLLITVFSVLGAVELRNILLHKNLIISVPEAVVLGALIPAAWTAVISFGITGYITAGASIIGASWLLAAPAFSRQEKLDSCIGRITAGFAVLIYPGLFAARIIQMSVFPEAGLVILCFLLIVFLNDGLAWAAGMLFGKNNRGLIPASPGKSIAGYAGGITASVVTGIAGTILLPELFIADAMPPAAAGALLGLATGIAAILGDLGESAIKRSANVKDSGSLILGRGGALDSIDSLLLAAPVFYVLYQILFRI